MNTSETIGMATPEDEDRRLKAAQRAMWAAGDYHRFAKELVWDIGRRLVDACEIGPDQQVLDVAAGSGNTALQAAATGAKVVASDLTPKNFHAGQREAESRGLKLEWVEGDAESLPFGDGEFDVVTSSFGAMFAPRHQRVADEMLRVCRPGGTIGMANFTPEGLAGPLFGVLAPYLPEPPADARPPLEWGSEAHVRALFGDRVGWLRLSREEYVERAPGPREYCDFFRETFGPVATIYAELADDPERTAELDRAFLEFATRENRGGPAMAEYPYEYLLLVARKAA